jgi:hypothetical protein
VKKKTPAQSQYKLGRLPARHTVSSIRRKMMLGIALESLGPPPSASDDFVAAVDKATGGDWKDLGNQKWGNCTCADTGHQMMLRTANAGTIIIPTEDQTVALYQQVCPEFNPNTGTGDDGADELSVIEFLAKTGWLGFKDDASGNIDPGQLDHVKWAVQICGASRIGIKVTQGMLDQFDAGKPWDGSGNKTVVGLHDVPIVKYDADGTLWVVTWAKLHPMTPGCFASIADEAHMELSKQWLEASGLAPNGLDWPTLVNDLQVEGRSYSERLRSGF